MRAEQTSAAPDVTHLGRGVVMPSVQEFNLPRQCFREAHTPSIGVLVVTFPHVAFDSINQLRRTVEVGNPWPRLIVSTSSARRDITEKIVTPPAGSFDCTSCVRDTLGILVIPRSIPRASSTAMGSGV